MLASLLRPQVRDAVPACKTNVPKEPKGCDEGPRWPYIWSGGVSLLHEALIVGANNSKSYQHFSWVYALRFLRASYAAESGNPSDNHAAIQNLQKISDLAIKQNDRAIQLTASLVEAMVHLKSANPDSIEHVQRAIAAARAHQLNLGSSIPQLNGLAHIIDVMCSIREGKVTEMLTKLRDMQSVMDEFVNNDKWSTSSDIMAIPINRTPKNSQTVSHETRAVLGIGEDGRDNLMMSFLNKRDAYGITLVPYLCLSLDFTNCEP